MPAAVAPLLQRIGALADAQRTRVHAVGGCVRDWWLRIPSIVDLDVTVEGDGLAFAEALARSLRGRLVTHAQFGTATVLLRGLRTRWVDVATCRQETYAAPGAYPRVHPGTLKDDLARRDFTMNAMALPLSLGSFDRLVDPFCGADDLAAKRLRILHARSFIDDPSRLLRGLRFARRFGLRWEVKTWRAARAAVADGLLARLNAGRFHKELDRMLQEPDPRGCLHALARLLADAPGGR